MSIVSKKVRLSMGSTSSKKSLDKAELRRSVSKKDAANKTASKTAAPNQATSENTVVVKLHKNYVSKVGREEGTLEELRRAMLPR